MGSEVKGHVTKISVLYTCQDLNVSVFYDLLIALNKFTNLHGGTSNTMDLQPESLCGVTGREFLFTLRPCPFPLSNKIVK